ncbi:unnamed protein product [Dovyalis caffra]|uniref:Uncharacterized protein n=1 Tax=Dovyalis caffra TaxID=77055 RepID=A0AAV1R0X3_9ROSI|nr:unnamed protein product [Dovyalis caffra]
MEEITKRVNQHVPLAAMALEFRRRDIVMECARFKERMKRKAGERGGKNKRDDLKEGYSLRRCINTFSARSKCMDYSNFKTSM